MKDSIRRIIGGNGPGIADLIQCLELVRQSGDVAVVKFDGVRNDYQYTAFITFSPEKKREMIRIDDSNLKDALLKLLKMYID
jgi:hypothetical protein